MTTKIHFTTDDLRAEIAHDLDAISNSLLESFKRAAKEAVENAKSLLTYEDQTGDLRSSIGYVIFHDGEEVANYFGATATTEGLTQGLAAARSQTDIYNRPGIVIIIVAGMDYASYVESTGYDVLSGSLAHFSEAIQQCFDEVKLQYQ